jgi:CHASE2 domain-containing sensor protein
MIDERALNVLVRMRRPQRRTDAVKYYQGKTLADPQPGCDVLAPGDRVILQLIDPYELPPLRAAPQRVAYEQVVAGDAAALALLRDRIVVVGTQLAGSDRMPQPWPAADRWGVELFAAQIDAMTRNAAIRPMGPLAHWVLITGLALLGAYCAHRLRERPRVLRIAALSGIALLWLAASIAWYRSQQQLIGVPYGIVALALGAWLANRNWTRSST